MLDKKILKQSLSFAALAVLYVALVATVMTNAQKLFSDIDKSVFAPIVFLLMLVVSVATMGLLIFGKPVMLYIDGKRREAVMMVICTVASLAFFTILLVVTFALFR
ncbi:MAG: hypothetical protein AAB431_01720 [Patescibacteria group bacterium]